MRDGASTTRPRRVLRVIARMNVGGPAYHVSILGGRLDQTRYETLLVHGRIGAGEASFAGLAQAEGCTVQELPSLAPEIRPGADVGALKALREVIRDFEPDLVHTHTAKAGMLGRLAAVAGRRRRPVVVHTFHGHVLEGYFGPVQTQLYRGFERGLARVSDCLIGVSRATVDDLVRLRIAPRDRFRVIPIGLDLERLEAVEREDGRAFRARVGAGSGDVLLTCVSRLVPIKRVDVLLRAVAEARSAGGPLRLAIVGDGPARPQLEALARSLGLDDAVAFTGYVLDVRPVLAASDVAVLSSDNEGTPVSLIEAAGAGRPAVATAVGGVPEVVTPESGILVPPGDHDAFAAALSRISADAELRGQLGARAKEHVTARFSAQRLVRDIEALYDELLERR